MFSTGKFSNYYPAQISNLESIFITIIIIIVLIETQAEESMVTNTVNEPSEPIILLRHSKTNSPWFRSSSF